MSRAVSIVHVKVFRISFSTALLILTKLKALLESYFHGVLFPFVLLYEIGS